MALVFYKQWRRLVRVIRSTLLGKIAYEAAFEGKTRSIHFVVATRSPERSFWTETMTGRKLAALRSNSEVKTTVFFENREGLPAVYNRALVESQADDTVVFVHDDIWLNDANVLERIRAGTKQFDIIGIAGNRRRVDAQPAWLFRAIEGGNFIWDHPNLSGAVRTGNQKSSALSYFGAAPAPCKLLDGVFLAARRKTLRRAGVKFDETFDFHLYDMDFCRTAEKAGLTMGTWPIDLVHESGGAFGSDGWKRNFAVYLKKWKK
ncbi:glycosyltransferase [Variovorax humicola]|uniref:Glycosyltransferase n=1 Tax=Variovorax humicola TaxID=1769758 RepID=A0ABU8VVV3_9BURK